LKLNETNPRHNPYKSDSFSTALTILHAANLKPCFKIYNKKKTEVDDYMVKGLIAEARQRYTLEFCNIL
jgi:hypothetical protein